MIKSTIVQIILGARIVRAGVRIGMGVLAAWMLLPVFVAELRLEDFAPRSELRSVHFDFDRADAPWGGAAVTEVRRVGSTPGFFSSEIAAVGTSKGGVGRIGREPPDVGIQDLLIRGTKELPKQAP